MGVNPMGLTLHARRTRAPRRALPIRDRQPPGLFARQRGCFFTGQYEEKHGVRRNGLAIDPNAVTLATASAGAGYSANYIGKRHLAPETDDRATWAPCPRNTAAASSIYGRGQRHRAHFARMLLNHSSTPLSAFSIPFSVVYRDDFSHHPRGVVFLRTRAKPLFLLVMSYLNTHHQNDSDTYIPPKELAGKYRDFFVLQTCGRCPAQGRASSLDYYGCVANIDSAVATLLAALKQQQFLDNTIVLFTSRSRLPLQDAQHRVQAQPARELDPHSAHRGRGLLRAARLGNPRAGQPGGGRAHVHRCLRRQWPAGDAGAAARCRWSRAAGTLGATKSTST